MNKALRSYKSHREKEKAENRAKLLKTAYNKRWYAGQTPARPSTPTGPRPKPRPRSSLPPKMDAIQEVRDANADATNLEER